jgi:hypothetical protein
MSGDKCFSNPIESNSSSDYTRTSKQKTIYKDVVNQVQSKTNFIKSNGVNYNENFGLHNQCLSFAKSYDLLLDVTKGKYYTKPVEDPNWVSNEAWSAGLYSVDYSANNVKTVVDTSYNAGNSNRIIFPMTQPAQLADISWNGLYPGVRVDPSYNIFYNECEDENYWREKLVDMSFNNTNYYIQNKQQSEQLYGMVYPGNVTFSCSQCINIDAITGQEKHILTITSGGQFGQPPAGTIIFQGYLIVDITQNPHIIVGIYENCFPINIQLPMNDPVVVFPANNIFPLDTDGVNFKSKTLLNGLGNITTNSSFNLYDNVLAPNNYRLYQTPGNINPNYYQITIV